MQERINWLPRSEAFQLGNGDGETAFGAAWVC
jgi:hypothetical protein